MERPGQDIYSQIAHALLKTDGSRDAARAVLEEKLGIGGLQGLEILAAYAQSDEENLTATQAEMGALQAARQIVRPLLEQKLQRRLDAVDGSKKKRRARTVR